MSLSSIFSSSHLAQSPRELLRAGLGLLAFAVTSAVLTISIDLLYQRVPLTQLDRRLIDFQQKVATTETLILGSSQMFHGVDPGLLGKNAFNVAGPSQDIYYDSQIVHRWLPDAPALKTVIWGIAPFTFGYDMATLPAESRRRALYDRYFVRRGDTCDLRCKLEGKLEMLRVRGNDPIGAFTRLWMASPGTVLRHETPKRNGFVPQKPLKEKEDGVKRARFHSALFRKEFVESNVQLLVATIKELQQKKVTVLLVVPPFSPSYRKGFSKKLLALHQNLLRQIEDETGAQFLDFSDALPFGQGLFKNSDHLQGEGTRRFSQTLADLLPFK